MQPLPHRLPQGRDPLITLRPGLQPSPFAQNDRSCYLFVVGKGETTRSSILRQALDLASEVGLEGLTVGVLAARVGMSKSGLYAHFESKEDLQCQVLDAAAARFVDVVVAPALKEPRGLPRLRAFFTRWLDSFTNGLSGGCPFVGAVVEFDDRPGQVRDRLVSHLRDMLGSFTRAASIAVDEGHLPGSVDVEQLAFEIWGIVLSYHAYARLLDLEDARERAVRAFERLIRDAGGA